MKILSAARRGSLIRPQSMAQVPSCFRLPYLIIPFQDVTEAFLMRDGSFGPQLCFGGGELPAFPMRDGSFGSLLFLWRREAPCIEQDRRKVSLSQNVTK